MKWYWAILQTLMIFSILVLIESFQPLPEEFYTVVAALFAIWVAADSASFRWGLFVLLLWPIAYPWYLIVRHNVRCTINRNVSAVAESPKITEEKSDSI